MKNDLVKISKFLSLILRHRPEAIGLTLDANGWADVEELIEKADAHGRSLDIDIIRQVVADNDKQRFVFSDDGARIRANQGHSIEVDLSLAPVVPQDMLYHGTAEKNLDSIRRQGLKKRRRHHVHLSSDRATALKVGSRHGRPVILQVHAGRMHQDGHTFYRSANGVWLTDHVPVDYLESVQSRS